MTAFAGWSVFGARGDVQFSSRVKEGKGIKARKRHPFVREEKKERRRPAAPDSTW